MGIEKSISLESKKDPVNAVDNSTKYLKDLGFDIFYNSVPVFIYRMECA